MKTIIISAFLAFSLLPAAHAESENLTHADSFSVRLEGGRYASSDPLYCGGDITESHEGVVYFAPSGKAAHGQNCPDEGVVYSFNCHGTVCGFADSSDPRWAPNPGDSMILRITAPDTFLVEISRVGSNQVGRRIYRKVDNQCSK